MTQPEKSDSDMMPVREWVRVEREPKFVAFDITSHCGPDANHVMLNTYENEHSYFITPAVAIKLAEALYESAITTQRPPMMEPPPWRRQSDLDKGDSDGLSAK